MCVKKTNVEVYSKERVSLVRMQDENTNSGGKQEKTSHVVKGKNDDGYLMIGKRWLSWTRARLWLEMTIESICAEKAMKHSNLTICANRKISVMIWVCISYNGVGSLTKQSWWNNKCNKILWNLDSCLWTVISQMVIIVFRMTMLLFIGLA